MQPSCQSIRTSQCVTLTTTVSGDGVETFTYQWKHNGENIKGENGSHLDIDYVTMKDGGSYQCIVKNQFGDSDVSTAELEVRSKHENCIGVRLF